MTNDNGVVMRTSNSVKVKISAINHYRNWQKIIVGGSVIFQWKVTPPSNSEPMNYYITFSKKNPSDKMKYVITCADSKIVNYVTFRMSIPSDQFGEVYCPDSIRYTKEVTVKISTDQSSPSAIIHYDDTELTDFMLRGEDGSVPFHKVVLAAHSSVFKTMLAGDWKETSEGVINVPGTSKEMLQYLKMYMYLGKLPDKQNDQADCIKQLLLLSSYYLIEDLKLRCIKELRFLLTPENLTEMIQFAMENNFKQLFVEILDCFAMGDINLNEVQTYIEADDVNLLQCNKTRFRDSATES